MRIFLISNMYPSKEDPLFGVFVKNFKELLIKQGVKFTATSVIKGKRAGALKKALAYFGYYLHVIKNHFFKKFDLRYVHYLSHNSPILYLTNALYKKSPLVVNVHGSDILDSQGRFIDKINIKVLKKTDLIITPSLYFKELMMEYYPFLESERIFVSPSGGINTKKFYPLNKKTNPKPLMGLISRIDKDKGWDDMLKAAKILQDKGFEFNMKIAGQGLEEGDMKQMIKDLKLENTVEFLGLINQDELIHLYNEIDVLLFPTKRKAESLGLVGLEAMSCKTPVIGSNIAGLKTYIDDGTNGYLFEPGNYEELSATIERFYTLSEEKRNELQAQALNTALQYEAGHIAGVLKNKLLEVCSRK